MAASSKEAKERGGARAVGRAARAVGRAARAARAEKAVAKAAAER